MSDKKDDYEILGVKKNASKEQIKSAYFRKAKQHHPDMNKMDPDAQTKFLELQKAYENLKAPIKKIPIKTTSSSKKYNPFRTRFYKKINPGESISDSFLNEFKSSSASDLDSPQTFVDINEDIRRKKNRNVLNELNEFNSKFEKIIEKFFKEF